MFKQLAKSLYLATAAARGENIRRYIPEYLTTQWLSDDELIDYRLRRFKEQVNWICERVPFYRRLRKIEGLSANVINSLDDLDKFPIISKRELQENPAAFRAENYHGRTHIETTGGSLGEPLAILKDAENLARKRAATWRFYGWYGIECGEKQARFWGLPFNKKSRTREKIKDFMGNRIRLNAFELNDSTYAGFYEKACSLRVDYVYGYASAIYAFADFVLRNKLANPFPVLKASIMTAETVYQAQRDAVEAAFGAPTAVEYGCGEVGIVAFECPEGNLHVNADNVILEIVDGSTVVTELHAKTTPLIRYRLGDSAAFSGTECRCGCGFPTLEYVAGRESDMLETGGKKVHCQALNYLFLGLRSFRDLIRQFQVIQRVSDGSLTVYIVPGDNYPQDGTKIVESIIRDRLDFRGVVNVKTVDRIPPDLSGKLRYFIRE